MRDGGKSMSRVYCTFSGSMYDQTTERIVKDSLGFGVHEVRVYDDRWLMEQPFYTVNRWIFEHISHAQHRGFGWYCWKPFVILQEWENILLNRAEACQCAACQCADDIILWTDADTFPIGDLTPLYDRCKADGGIMLFAAEGWAQGQATKRSCMVAMGADNEAGRKAQHATARFALFEVGNWRAQQFLMEWLAYCLNPMCVGLDLDQCGPQYPEYQEHRSDQSILTNLAHKYGLRLYREADQFGDGTDRDREIFGTVFKQIGCYDKPRNLNGSKWRNV